MDGSRGYSLEIVDDLKFENWILIPSGLSEIEQAAWIDSTVRKVCGLLGVEPSSETAVGVMSEVLFAVARNEESDPVLTYQIWLVDQPVSILVQVDLVSGEYVSVGDDPRFEVVTHEAEAEFLGSGLQHTTRYESKHADLDLVQVELVFADDDVSVVLTVSAAPAALVATVLPAFIEFKDVIRVHGPNGQQFAGVPVRTDEIWAIESGELTV